MRLASKLWSNYWDFIIIGWAFLHAVLFYYRGNLGRLVLRLCRKRCVCDWIANIDINKVYFRCLGCLIRLIIRHRYFIELCRYCNWYCYYFCYLTFIILFIFFIEVILIEFVLIGDVPYLFYVICCIIIFRRLDLWILGFLPFFINFVQILFVCVWVLSWFWLKYYYRVTNVIFIFILFFILALL